MFVGVNGAVLTAGAELPYNTALAHDDPDYACPPATKVTATAPDVNATMDNNAKLGAESERTAARRHGGKQRMASAPAARWCRRIAIFF
jgi:hypothetical protein